MTWFVTTPIYYVNDRPHLGHLYTTVVADILARFHRLRGGQVVLSSGTDEHAVKVSAAAAARGLSTAAWADGNAVAFRAAFARFDVALDDFIRTSEARHREVVADACARLLASGDFYRGRYDGWYDESQEEYVPDSRAAAQRQVSAVTGKPLVRRSEEAAFFRLGRFAERVAALLENGGLRVTPEPRRQEVLARLRAGVHDVPVSRRADEGWGVPFPGAPGETVWVWVDALLNYLTVARAHPPAPWPPDLHLVGKEILWFHAVLWPALLLALGDAGVTLAPPVAVHAHSHWVRDGRKMSKSLGNFLDLETLERLAGELGTDAVRWYFAAQGPLRATDADFSEAALRALRDADLANGLGNCVGRVVGIVSKHFDGLLPAATAHGSPELPALALSTREAVEADLEALALDRIVESLRALVTAVDRALQAREPYRLAHDPRRRAEAGAVLSDAAQALVVAVSLASPIIPRGARELLRRLGAGEPAWPDLGSPRAGVALTPGAPVFPRA
jgi:methionyl-tRNA synthetase